MAGCGTGSGDSQETTEDTESASEAAFEGGSAGEAPALLRGTAPPADGSVPSLVTLRPGNEDTEVVADAPPARRATATIDQFGLQFSPTELIVDVGATLAFTNSEGALAHNVHIRSVDTGESLFNEDANSGDVLETTLTEAGGYDILCDMHPGMTAFVFATGEPYAVAADAEGTFSFPGVPAGTYEARLWTAGEGFSDPEVVTVPAGGTVLDLRTQH
jgi:plastocyanin